MNLEDPWGGPVEVVADKTFPSPFRVSPFGPAEELFEELVIQGAEDSLAVVMVVISRPSPQLAIQRMDQDFLLAWMSFGFFVGLRTITLFAADHLIDDLSAVSVDSFLRFLARSDMSVIPIRASLVLSDPVLPDLTAKEIEPSSVLDLL